MNKKAFTLIELLGVIVILGIIGVIVTPIIQNTIDNSNKKLCNEQIDSFKKAAKNYIASNPFTNLNEGTTEITIGELQNKGYIENQELKNPKGGNFSVNSIIKIIYNGKKVTYTYDKAHDEKGCEE